jgi:hypothetical protein
MFESVLDNGHPLDEPEISLCGGHVEDFTTVIGPGSINQGPILAMSKSREEAGVSVPSRVSESVDPSLEESSLWLNCGLPRRWHI